MISKLCLRLVVALFLGGRIAALVTSQIGPSGDQPAFATAGKPDNRGHRLAEPQILARAVFFYGWDDVELENTTADPEAEHVVVGGEG